MTTPLLAIVIGAVVGALAVWTLAFFGLPVEGWMAALLVTCFALAGGVAALDCRPDMMRSPGLLAPSDDRSAQST